MKLQSDKFGGYHILENPLHHERTQHNKVDWHFIN